MGAGNGGPFYQTMLLKCIKLQQKQFVWMKCVGEVIFRGQINMKW